MTIAPPGEGPFAAYPGVVLPSTPFAFGGVVSWEGTTGNNAAVVFIVANDQAGFYLPGPGHPLNMLHIVWGSGGGLSVNVYSDGEASEPLFATQHVPKLSGAGNEISFFLDGDMLAIYQAGKKIGEVSDPRIAEVVGPIVIFEPYVHDYPAQDFLPRFDSVYAEADG